MSHSRYHVARGEGVCLDERETLSFVRASQAILKYNSFAETARIIFDQACELTGAASGYVALLSEDGHENEVLFLESGGLPCTVDPSLPMPIRGLRAKAYHHNITVYDNEFMGSEFAAMMPEGHVALENVMFAPLVIGDKTVGIIGLANKPSGFTPRDADLASMFGGLAAIALSNSRSHEKLKGALNELEKAIAEIKQLHGIIPICVCCKQIKDEKGLWNQMEKYISEHTDAMFSHGLCPKCAKKVIEEELGDIKSK